jgi:galactonate dehydratase
MKITTLDLFHVKPRWLFLRISTDEGIDGWGEPIIEGRARTVETAIRELEGFLIGQDASKIEYLWQSMYRNSFYRGGPILVSAISGIEQALWDIKGKYHEVPVYEMLGGMYREKIRMYAHCWGSTTDKIVARALDRKQRGFTAIKILLEPNLKHRGLMSYVESQVERFATIRDAVGKEMDIGIDFHGRVSPDIAIQLARELEPYYPLFIEEPCLPENPEALINLSRATTVPIATGERLFTRWGFREILQKHAVAIIQPDISHAGGLLEVKKIASMAEMCYISVAPHNPLGPVSLAVNLQFSACTPNFLIQEHFGMKEKWDLGEGYLKEPFIIEDGYIEIQNKPGLGIEVNEEVLTERAYSGDWDSPRLYYEDDGSIADW